MFSGMRRPKGNHTSRKFQNSFHVTRRQPKYESKINCLKYYSGCELSQSDGGPFMLSTSSTVAAKLCQILAKFCTFHQQTNTSSVCTLLIYYKYKTWSRSLQKSDRERFTHDLSESLAKSSDSLEKLVFFIKFWQCLFTLFCAQEEIAHIALRSFTLF